MASQQLLKYLAEHRHYFLEYPMLIVALSTGLRFSELVGLTIGNVDLKAGRIAIVQQWNFKEGGGFGPLKNEASERRINVDKLTLTILKELILKAMNDKGNKHQLVLYEKDSPIQVVTNDHLNDVLRRCLRDLKITPSITAHCQRHTHASILLYKGISLLYVSERLDHASLDITTSTYAYLMI